MRPSGEKWYSFIKNNPYYENIIPKQDSELRTMAIKYKKTESLEIPIDPSVFDRIIDNNIDHPSKDIELSYKAQIIDDILESLFVREKITLQMRFGLCNGGYPFTLEEVGKALNVTRERVRQIEAKALRKMRHPTRAAYLRQLIDFEARI